MVSLPLYLDYNATSPLSRSVQSELLRGDFLFANPASQHQSGKHSRKIINQATQFIFEHFHLESKTHRLIYQSGATEGINTVIKGMSEYSNLNKKKFVFLVSPLDHSCVLEAEDWLVSMGAEFYFYPITERGEVLWDELSSLIKEKINQDCIILINLTWVHNETGVVIDLTPAMNLKHQQVFFHIDAVQTVGKINNYAQLIPELDFYSYSGHKFGSLKGIGFSFISKKIDLPPLIWGGGQQGGLRPGTENILGIQSMQWALQDFLVDWDPAELSKNHDLLEKSLIELMQNKGEVLFLEAPRNLNTTYFYLKTMASDMALAIFDLEGIELSTGSACASGAAKKSAVMKKVGLERLARNGLRLSHSPFLKKEDVQEIIERFKNVMDKI